MDEQTYLKYITAFKALIDHFTTYIVSPYAQDAKVAPNIKPEEEFYRDENNLKEFIKKLEKISSALLSDIVLLKKYKGKISLLIRDMSYRAREYGIRWSENYSKYLVPFLTKLSNDVKAATIRL